MIVAPLMHGAAQWGMCNMLFAGAGVALYTQRGLDPDEIWDIVEREKCMGLTIVGDAMGRPLADALAHTTRDRDFSGFYRVGSGGGVFSPAVQEAIKAEIPHVAGDGQLRRLRDGRRRHERRGRCPPLHRQPRAERARRRPPPGGRPARSAVSPAPATSRSATTRTRPRPRATFPTDPDGRRWSVPGDFATVDDDGVVTLLGRGSQCINTGGEKVYPEEVEEALKSHPDVYDALVVGVPDERWGERVVAVVQARGDARPTVEEIAPPLPPDHRRLQGAPRR